MLPGSTKKYQISHCNQLSSTHIKNNLLDFTKLCVLAPKSHHLEDIASEVTFDHRQIK